MLTMLIVWTVNLSSPAPWVRPEVVEVIAPKAKSRRAHNWWNERPASRPFAADEVEVGPVAVAKKVWR